MRVDLVSMPWAIFNRPSIQLGCLKSWLDREKDRHRVRCHHPYLYAARALGPDLYRRISENPWAGEALFSPLLFPGRDEEARRLFAREIPALADRFRELVRDLADGFEEWLDQADLAGPGLVGLSVCFSQLIPSLYAARRIRERHPERTIVLGGSTCTPSLARGLLDSFSFLDHVILGEGERPLAELAHLLAEGRSPTGENILSAGDVPPRSPADREVEPSRLPLPDYDDYFRELADLGFAFLPELPLEFSRGCWWNRCTFCNLNLQWCGYRAKDHQQVLQEAATLIRRHHCLDLFFTDNALPPAEAGRFFAQTADWERDARFFAEIRIPRSQDECELFRAGGLTTVQAGIEALSDSLLKRMNKGTRSLDNVAAMKFAAAADIRLEGNLILEFPGSTDQEVEETLAMLDLVLPYRPLSGAAFFLGQGSPVSRDPARFGIKALIPHANNRLLYPPEILAKLDLLIWSYRGDRVLQRRRWRPVRRALRRWQEFHEKRRSSRPALSMRDGGDFLIIRQERPDSPVLHQRLKGLSRRIYLACGEPVEKKVLLERFRTVKEDQLSGFLRQMRDKKLMAGRNDRWLALAVPET